MPQLHYFRSLSFVLCLGGFAFLLLCTCYILIDEKKIWNGAPFYYPGKKRNYLIEFMETICWLFNIKGLNCTFMMFVKMIIESKIIHEYTMQDDFKKILVMCEYIHY